MADTIDDLELSVRANNVLQTEGVKTIEQFMTLTKSQVMNFKGAGSRTWQEVSEVQGILRDKARHETLPGRVRKLLRELNGLQPDIQSEGFFLTFDGHMRLRLGRFVTARDLDP